MEDLFVQEPVIASDQAEDKSKIRNAKKTGVKENNQAGKQEGEDCIFS